MNFVLRLCLSWGVRGLFASALVLLVSTLGHALLVGAVVGAMGFIAMTAWDYSRGGLRFHDGIVCVSGKHVSHVFYWFNTVPSTLAGILAALVTFLVLPETSDYRYVAPLAGIITYLPAYMVSEIVFAKTTLAFWEDQWGAMVEAIHPATVDEENMAGTVKCINEDIQSLFFVFDRQFSDDPLSEEELAEAYVPRTVHAFEELLIQALVHRGYLFDIGPQLVFDIRDELAIPDPEERQAWLDRDIDAQVWNDIRSGYNGFLQAVMEAQMEAVSQRQHEQEEMAA